MAAQHPEVVDRLRREFERWFQDVTEGVEYRPVPIPVGHVDEPVVEIQPSWANWKGNHVEYVFRGYDWDTLQGWKTAGEQATWNLDVLRAGHYQVFVRYARSGKSEGPMRLSVGRSSLEFDPPATPTGDVFEEISIGQLQLSAGPATLKVEVVETQEHDVLRLNSIRLKMH